MKSNNQKPSDIGLLGRIFGSATHGPTNTAGILVLLLTIGGLLALFVPTRTDGTALWSEISPILMLALGYLFGRVSSA